MKKILCFLFAAMFLFTALPVSAASVSDMRSDYEQMEKELADLKKSLSKLKGKESTALEQVANYNEQISLIEDEIDAVNALIDRYNEQIGEKNAEIETLNEKIGELDASIAENYAAFKERLKVFHKTGDASTLEILFGSESLADFFNRYAVVKTVAARDKKLMDDLSGEIDRQEKQKQETETLKAEIEEQVAETEALKADLLKKQDELEDMKKEAQSVLNKIKKDEKTAQNAINNLNKDMEELEKEIEEATRNSKGKFDGSFAWPLPKSYTHVSSGFGYRTHPITGQKQSFHKGIDLPAPKNTAITATAGGTVTTAYNTSHGSYGKYVIIEHGGGYVSVYAHCNEVLVKKGDKVSQGQQIAKVGTTGTSTGYHLHFEIRSNGNYTDPRDYFPSIFK